MFDLSPMQIIAFGTVAAMLLMLSPLAVAEFVRTLHAPEEM